MTFIHIANTQVIFFSIYDAACLFNRISFTVFVRFILKKKAICEKIKVS